MLVHPETTPRQTDCRVCASTQAVLNTQVCGCCDLSCANRSGGVFKWKSPSGGEGSERSCQVAITDATPAITSDRVTQASSYAGARASAEKEAADTHVRQLPARGASRAVAGHRGDETRLQSPAVCRRGAGAVPPHQLPSGPNDVRRRVLAV